MELILTTTVDTDAPGITTKVKVKVKDIGDGERATITHTTRASISRPAPDRNGSATFDVTDGLGQPRG